MKKVANVRFYFKRRRAKTNHLFAELESICNNHKTKFSKHVHAEKSAARDRTFAKCSAQLFDAITSRSKKGAVKAQRRGEELNDGELEALSKDVRGKFAIVKSVVHQA